MLSMVAALQAPIIMMSQNRQAAKDRLESRIDFETNAHAAAVIDLVHEKLDLLAHTAACSAEINSQRYPKVRRFGVRRRAQPMKADRAHARLDAGVKSTMNNN